VLVSTYDIFAFSCNSHLDPFSVFIVVRVVDLPYIPMPSHSSLDETPRELFQLAFMIQFLKKRLKK